MTSPIPGVRWGRAVRHADRRGALAELWRASDLADLTAERCGLHGASIVQANASVSAPGVLRGLHLHRRQLDRWYLLSGRAFVALVDARPTFADPAAAPIVELREAGPDDWVEIPAGVAHGFLALEPVPDAHPAATAATSAADAAIRAVAAAARRRRDGSRRSFTVT